MRRTAVPAESRHSPLCSSPPTSPSVSLARALSPPLSSPPVSSVMESNGKKIQFAVPALQSRLDPTAAEHIRRRRPTPATLVVYRETSAELQPSSQSGQHAQARPAQRKRSVYTPPTLIERELPEDIRNQEVTNLGLTRPVSTVTESSSGSTPRRKDTPYQHLPPFTPGGRLLENRTPFSEEEEQDGEEEEREEEDGEEEEREEEEKGVPQ